MNGAQCRAARALLGISQDKLAGLAGVSKRSIATYELGGDVSFRIVHAMQEALEAAGVEFTNGGQPGVKVKAD